MTFYHVSNRVRSAFDSLTLVVEMMVVIEKDGKVLIELLRTLSVSRSIYEIEIILLSFNVMANAVVDR